MKYDKMNYKFKQLSKDIYLLEMVYTANHNLINKLFNLTSIKFKEVIVKNPFILKKFEVPPIYYKNIKFAIKKHFSKICKEVLKDGVKVIDNKIHRVTYMQTINKDWTVYIEIKGFMTI